jgi:SAM-dependent methyltransferase
MTDMGDDRRFEVFADFLKQEFPNARQVADVAGGQGRLVLELVKRGFQAVVIDVRNTALPRKDRKRLRKGVVTGRDPANVRRMRMSIADTDLSAFDLIVALHPDAATEWVVRRAVVAGKAFAVVPCCVMPLDGIHRSLEAWLNYLQSLAPGSRVVELPFGGRNRVIVHNPLENTLLGD